MAQLYFRYSTMNSGKTANLLMVAHNYEEQNKQVLIFKPTLDTRSTKNKIESRIGMSHNCIDIDKEFEILKCVAIWRCENKSNNLCCILVDEAQFLTKDQVLDLTYVVDLFKIPVICYGLKNSFINGELFEGSKFLLYYSDKIEELKNVCIWCNKKATMNLHIVDGIPTYSGDMIHCGDTKVSEDYYIPTCREHYFHPELDKLRGESHA